MNNFKLFGFSIFFVIGLAFFPFPESVAQNQGMIHDSIFIPTKAAYQSDSLRIIDLLEEARLVRKADDLISHGHKADSLIQVAKQLAWQEQLGPVLLQKMDEIGVYERNQAMYHEALFWHKTELSIADSLMLPRARLRALNNLGVVHRRMDDYRVASDYHLRAMALAEELDDDRSYLVASNGLGNIQYMLGNYQEALRRFREGLAIEQQLNNLVGVAINLNNIGNVFFKQNDFDKALEYYLLSLEVNREAGSSKGVAICYNDLGNVYRERQQFSKALNYYLLGLDINKSIGDLNYLAQSNINVGALYLEMGEPEKALPYINEGLQLAKETNALITYKRAIDLMYTYHKNKGHYKQAIAYMEESNKINDSILGNNLRRTVIQMQTLFDRERSESQIALLQHQKELADLRMKDQRLVNLIYNSGLILLMLTLLIGIYLMHIKTKSNKLLRKQKTEIEHAQAELKVYADKLLQAKDEAEHHSKLKSQFLANMSHEIRTPMNSIIGFADILHKLIDNSQHRTFLEAIRNSGQSLIMLINDILDLSKIEADKMIIDNGPLNLRVLANEIKQLFLLQLREKQLNFKLQLDEALPDEVFLSEVRLRQILFNLIGNAIKFTDQGSIGLRIFATESTNKKELIDLHIVISDTGIGIDKEDQDKIFEAFYQHPSHAANLKGTGLGLAITQRLVKAMNGSINLESQIGVGTVFSICFKDVKPIQLAIEPSDYFNEVRYNEVALSNVNAHKILLLTQNPVKHHLIDEIADQTGYDMMLAKGSDEFMELFGTHHPHCLIIDPEEAINPLKKGLFIIMRERNLQLIYIDELSPSQQQQYPDGVVFKLPDQQDLLKHFLIKLHNEILTNDLPDDQLILQENIELSPVFEKVHHLWLKALGSNVVGDAQQLAIECINVADENKLKELYHYGKSLEAAVENFDVEQISRLLRQFQNLKVIETKG